MCKLEENKVKFVNTKTGTVKAMLYNELSSERGQYLLEECKKGNHRIFCGCQSDSKEIEMHVRWIGDEYRACASPNTAVFHREGCPKHHSESTGDIVDSLKWKDKDQRGYYNIEIKLGNDKTYELDVSPTSYKKHARGVPQRTWLGLHCQVMAVAGLDEWAGNRSREEIENRLTESSHKFKLDGLPLKDGLHILKSGDWYATGAYKTITTQCYPGNKFMIMGVVKNVGRKCAGEVEIWLDGLDAPVIINEKLQNTVCRMYKAKHISSVLNNPDYLHWVLLQADVNECDGSIYCGRLSIIRTNNQAVMVDSKYELRYANMLQKNNIAYKKPLYAPKGMKYRCDFIIYWTFGKPVIVEIYGMTNNEDYQNLKLKKQTYYPKLYGFDYVDYDLSNKEIKTLFSQQRRVNNIDLHKLNLQLSGRVQQPLFIDIAI